MLQDSGQFGGGSIDSPDDFGLQGMPSIVESGILSHHLLDGFLLSPLSGVELSVQLHQLSTPLLRSSERLPKIFNFMGHLHRGFARPNHFSPRRFDRASAC
ncbi:hypothetical protein GUJ93_ZPchr0001g31967 [Zizania palustris]|uniref:Uncharacterized protein n=1 Tax=Zizania palustris TaxID=103762 RepID=A0A8J5RSM4_ZIZPA|nr:hypothetical protein GUJ93_ZPchr0001g31967 [Zizania palustris]